MLLWIRWASHKTPLKLLWTAEGTSSLVNQFMQLLLPWYVLSTTGSLLWTGFIGFCSLLPNIFSSLYGGKMIDKLGRSKMMLSCEVIQFVLLGAIPILIACHAAYPWLIGVLIFLSSFFDAPGQLARTALAPTFSRYAEVSLPRATGVVEALDGIMSVFGPILGGIFIAFLGLYASWVAVVVMCAFIVLISLTIYSRRNRRLLSNPTTFSHAWQLLKADYVLRDSILFTMPFFILGQSWELLLLPGYIYQYHYDPVYLGLLGAAFGLGAFMGALYFARAAKKFKFFTLLTANYAAYTLSVLVLYYNFPKTVVLGATWLCGIPFGAFSAMISTLILLRAPENLRGKILGIFATASYTVESLCVLGIAVFMHFLGLQKTLAFMAYMFSGLILISVIGRKKNDFWAETSGKTPLPPWQKVKKKKVLLLEYKPGMPLRRTEHIWTHK